MSRFTRSTRRCLGAAGVALAALVAPAGLRAQTSMPKVFHACYVPNSGTVYRIKEVDLKQECTKPTHVQFSWTDGTNPPGFTEIRSLQGPFVEIAANSSGFAHADCPEGFKAVSGSHFIGSPSNQVVIRFDASNGANTGWVVQAANTDPSAVLKIAAVVKCVR